MSDSKWREELAEVLAAHQYMPCAEHTPTVNAWWAQCEGCDWRGPRRSHRHADEGDHRAHLADLLARMLAEAKAEALREAADEAWGRSCEARPAPTWRGVTAWLREMQRSAEASGREGEHGPQ